MRNPRPIATLRLNPPITAAHDRSVEKSIPNMIPAARCLLVPIGTDCEGEELLVLNEELESAPLGEVGRLYIRGVGLSPGS